MRKRFLDVTAYVICTPGRFNWAAYTLKHQTVLPGETVTVSETFPDKDHVQDHLIKIYERISDQCQTEWMLIVLGDVELPPEFLEAAYGSGADVYGCCYLYEGTGKLYGGLNGAGIAQAMPYGYEPVFPDCMMLVRTALAKSYRPWSNRTGNGGVDHFIPFMMYAKSKNAKITVDKTILATHHVER